MDGIQLSESLGLRDAGLKCRITVPAMHSPEVVEGL